MSRSNLCRLVCALVLGVILSPAQAQLVLYYSFDADAGAVAVDDSGNGYDGTIIDAVWQVGGFDGGGACMDFAGGGSIECVEVADALNGLEAMTVMLWVKSNITGADHGFINFVDPDGGDFGGMRYDAASWAFAGGTNCITIVTPNTGPRARIESASNLQVTEWQHIAMVWSSGGGIHLYVDGEEDTAPTGADDPGAGEITGIQKVIVGRGAKDSAAGASWDGLLDEVRIYGAALSPDQIQLAMLGSDGPEFASSPDPADGATDVPRDTMLTWQPGDFAVTHNVYLGTSFDDVNDAATDAPLDVLLSEAATVTTIDPGTLEFGRTYYWRVDEVNGAPDRTVFKGEVWSFTVEPLAYPIEAVQVTAAGADPGAGPENTINGSGLNADDQHSVASPDMWLATADVMPIWIQYEFDRVYKLHELLVWNYNVQFEPVLGYGLKDVTIEYSTDGAEWMVLGDFEFAQATAGPDYVANTTVDLAGAAARYVRLLINDNWGPFSQYGLSEVRFLQIPTFARQPQPADGATQVDPAALLSWRPGREAAAHDVYLGAAPEAMVLVDTVTADSYAPADLEFGGAYYWRIDEVNETAEPTTWEGDLWSFATLEYVVIDDFESYNDDDNRIFDTWLDGFVNETGSTVGYFAAPFAERTIVNGGSQSMPLEYVNDAAPFYSEAEYDLGGMDLDTNGADTLRLFVAGQAPTFAETADGTIVMNAIGADIWDTADEFRYVYKQLTGDGSITVRVDAIDATPNGWVKGGVMIRQNTEPGSANALTALTGGSGDGATFQWRPEADATSNSSRTLTGIAPPYYVRLVREGSTFTGYLSPDGVEWMQQGDSATDVVMTDPVLIGLALTSHNIDQATGAAFSDVATSGQVSGNWQIAEIGVAQPTTGNAIEPLYVALEDNSGNVAVVAHPNPAAVAIAAWQEWLIPYSDLAGVNLSRVATIYIGIGDRDNPTAGGTGMIFIDDIAYGHPAVE